jgi:hypothetical protein
MNVPAAPPPPPPAAPSGLPWERRAETGALQGFADTVRRIATEPAAAFRDARRRGDLVSPLAYAVVLILVGALAERLWGLLVGTSLLDLMPAELRDNAALGFAMSGLGLAVTLIVAPILGLCVLFVWSAIVHLFLMLYGGTRDSDTGFEGTLRSLAWSSTAQLGQLVPFAGGLIALVWGIVLQTISLASFHRTTQGKALAAVLTPLVLCCVCIAVFAASLVALVAGGIAAGAGGR